MSNKTKDIHVIIRISTNTDNIFKDGHSYGYGTYRFYSTANHPNVMISTT